MDIAPRLIENAIAASPEYGEKIEFLAADVTDNELLTRLESKKFEAISCGTAIMDMVDIEPLAEAVARLLKPGGRFVFTVVHPLSSHPTAYPALSRVSSWEMGGSWTPLRLSFLTTSIQRRTRV